MQLVTQLDMNFKEPLHQELLVQSIVQLQLKKKTNHLIWKI